MQALKVLAPIVGVLMFAAPVFAQVADGYGTTSSGNYCPKLSTTMQRGARDASSSGQVSELQKFISDYYDIAPGEIATGFFGRITQGYVIKFQKERGLPSFGIVGSLTRAAIAKVCGDNSTAQSSTNTQNQTQNTTNTVKTLPTPQNISLQDFVTGHNIATADRINLVFVGINFASVDEFKITATEMLGWDGRPSRGGRGFGPFAIEPLRSNKNKFNVWYDPTMITGATTDDINSKIESKKAALANSGLSYVVPMFLNKDTPQNTFIAPHADAMGITLSGNSFSSLSKGNLHPGAVLETLNMNLTDASNDTKPSQLAHELGHGIFGLADEKTDAPYDRAGTAPRIHAPDCVATMADAQALWGGLVGQVDPFYTEWKQTLQQNGQWNVLFPSDVTVWRTMDEGMKVGYYYGNCYGDTNGRNVIRPTDFSIMHQSQVAVFGPVNRRQIETVLGFFSGSADSPTPEPPKSTVDLMLNGSNGPITASPNQTVTAKWSSTGTASCELFTTSYVANPTIEDAMAARISGLLPSGSRQINVTEGMYAVSIYCRTASGASVQDTVRITNVPTNSSISFVAAPSSGTVPLSVGFYASGSSIVSAASYTIDFGDGTTPSDWSDMCQVVGTGNCIATVHRYSSAGTYTAKLISGGNVLRTTVISITSAVQPEPVAKAPTCSLNVKTSRGEVKYGLTGTGYYDGSGSGYVEIYQGDGVTVSWTSTNADYSIGPGGDQDVANGTATYNPGGTKAYVWTFYGKGGKTICGVMVELRN